MSRHDRPHVHADRVLHHLQKPDAERIPLLRGALVRQLRKLHSGERQPGDEIEGLLIQGKLATVEQTLRAALLDFASLTSAAEAEAVLTEVGGWPPSCGAVPELGSAGSRS